MSSAWTCLPGNRATRLPQGGQRHAFGFSGRGDAKRRNAPAAWSPRPDHFALGIPTDSLDDWKKHFADHGVKIEKEVKWPRGGKSLYFRDPAGNSVELMTRGLWGLPDG